VLVALAQPVFNVLIIPPCQQGVKCNRKIDQLILLAGCNICSMDDELIRKVRSELGRQGGLARAKTLTAKERKAIATKASKAASRARTAKAKERKAAR
jgi:hypothetical protein